MPPATRACRLRHVGTLTLIAFLTAATVLDAAEAPSATGESELARQILDATGVTGGLVVHVGCAGGRLTARLGADDGYLVQGLDTEAGNVKRARRYLKSLGSYGSVTADTFDGQRLPYTDNLVNLLVVSEAFQVSNDEMMRVLAPGGVAYVHDDGQWEKTVKPWPNDIDQWTHYLHGPDNNAVAQDTVVGPPRHMQWLAGPRWTRTHHKLCSISSAVTARGRLFYIFDEATAANTTLAGKWSIIARDAFSGVLLWKKPIDSWAQHTIRFRSGPPQVTRLLVASEDRLYAPLGLSAPVSVIDPASGETLATYAETEGAEEIVLVGDTLLVLKGSPVAEHAAGHPAFAGQIKLPNEKTILAVDTQTGQTMWQWSDADANPMPETLGSDGEQVYVQVGESVVCLDLKSGREVWTFGERGSRKDKRISYGKYTLVVADGVVLCKLDGNLTALAAKNGEKLWDCKAGGGFHSPMDIFVIDGKVWGGLHTSDSVSPPPVDDFCECRDLHTGEVSRENQVMVDLQTAGHHHRCYREKATSRYIMAGKRGIEMMDLCGDNHSRNNWVRGACQYGILPANGLVYAPPHSCGCYMESKLWGFWALAAERAPDNASARVPDHERLEKGPAYGKETSGSSQSVQSWPQFRHDPLRSGVAGTVLPADLEPAWNTEIGGRLTQPVVADGTVVLAAVDENTVYALDEETGKILWQYVAGGRVDSPPAIHNGMVLFGSADGRTYCLRLDDGTLVWRFLAAAADTRAVALNQVESLWPVHGSVLLLDGVVYCAAGRSTWLDGGIDLYGLDPATGNVVCQTHFESRHPAYEENKEGARKEHVTRIDQNTTDYKTFLAPDLSDSFSMAGGAVADVLVSDGTNVFMHHVKFDPKLEKQDGMSRHLFSTSNLLDGAENHRSHWVLGTGDFSRIPVAYSWIVNGGGKRMPTIAVPTGLMMVFDEDAVWGIEKKYQLVAKENRPFSDNEPFLPDFRTISHEEARRSRFSAQLSLRPRAMLKSGDALIIGGMPDIGPTDDPYATYEGRSGGSLVVVSIQDGSTIAEYELPSPVVWDGMAAAGGKLYLSTSDGSVRCFSPEQ